MFTCFDTFCTNLAVSGIAPQMLQEIMGHSSFETTRKYLHINPLHLKHQVANFSVLESPKGNLISLEKVG